MGDITKQKPKCMTDIGENETILSRQLKFIYSAGITDVVITTGYFSDILEEYCISLNIPLKYHFINNPLYSSTNYIYSIYCARHIIEDDILLMHGDLVFEKSVLYDIINFEDSCMKVSTTLNLPKKDFKAVLENGKIIKIGIDFFENAVEAQPLYKINKSEWKIWLGKICEFCESENYACYAENAFNEISHLCGIFACDVKNRLCTEIDTPEDLHNVLNYLEIEKLKKEVEELKRENEFLKRAELSFPDIRRGRLRKAIKMKGLITAMEAHSGLTGLIVENTVFEEQQFDAMWISSLCDSTAKGKPDIELVDMTSRFRTIDDICEVTTKPIIFDGDTGGVTEHFVYTVRSLERMGVSMVIIEDKTGLKKNSLFGNEVIQTQDSIENFSAKIRAGKKAQRTDEFMICARIESLILEKGMEDALKRANAFVDAGADAIMIHSRKNEPDEIFEFAVKFRQNNKITPLVVVPTSFNSVTEDIFKSYGINVVIYANQLTRTGFPAMQNAAKLILKNHRAKECDELCMPFKDIIRIIPENI